MKRKNIYKTNRGEIKEAKRGRFDCGKQIIKTDV